MIFIEVHEPRGKSTRELKNNLRLSEVLNFKIKSVQLQDAEVEVTLKKKHQKVYQPFSFTSPNRNKFKTKHDEL